MGTEVKISGLTNKDDALAALDAGADYLGFVLYAESPRGITVSAMTRILAGLALPFRAIGVFVNASRDTVERAAVDNGLYAVQLHGDEAPESFAGLPVPMWRAVRLRGGQARPAPETWAAERYVVDSAVPGLYGGTGVPADWSRAAQLARRHSIMLAGGLVPENVAEAIRAVRPRGVDVASGVEQAPGKKDLARLKDFVRLAKGPAADGEQG